jgi:hypothetical protein
MTRLARLLERLIHGDKKPVPTGEDATPADVLEALEWSDTDSGDDLVERAEAVERKGAPVGV